MVGLWGGDALHSPMGRSQSFSKPVPLYYELHNVSQFLSSPLRWDSMARVCQSGILLLSHRKGWSQLEVN